MEIRIRTAEEFHAAHVTIEIRAEDQDEAARVAELLAERAGDAGTIEGLRDRLADVEQQLATAQQAREIETRERIKAEGQAREYDRDRHTEQHRANLNGAKVIALGEELERFRRAHVCTDRCTKDAHVAFEGKNLLKELEADLVAERQVTARLEGEARRLRQEMERRFTSAQVEVAKEGAREDARADLQREVIDPMKSRLTDAELDSAALAGLLGRVNGLALGSEVRRALEYLPAEPGTYAHTVSVALRKIRELLGVGWDKAPRAPREV